LKIFHASLLTKTHSFFLLQKETGNLPKNIIVEIADFFVMIF